MKKSLLFYFLLLIIFKTSAQDTYPVNGSRDKRPGLYAFTHANIMVSAGQLITDGTLLVNGEQIEAIGQGINIPKGYVKIDLKGKYMYPSFVDAFTSYGLPEIPKGAKSKDGKLITNFVIFFPRRW
jgi:hypothetical protein